MFIFSFDSIPKLNFIIFFKGTEILVDYKRTIYSKTINVSSKEYPQMRSDVCIKNSLIFHQYLTTDITFSIS
jgi:hypothetical protein